MLTNLGYFGQARLSGATTVSPTKSLGRCGEQLPELRVDTCEEERCKYSQNLQPLNILFQVYTDNQASPFVLLPLCILRMLPILTYCPSFGFCFASYESLTRHIIDDRAV